MKKNNSVLGANRPNSRNGNPGLHHTNDNFNLRRLGRWQPIVSFLSITPNKNTVSEGGVVIFTVNVEGLSDGSTIYWTTQSLNGTISAADFTDNQVSGSATVAGNVATITRNILFDGTAEAGDAFRILVRTDSISGPVVLGSSLVEIIQSTVTVVPNLPQPYSAQEGSTIQWTINTTFIENGTVLYWTIDNTTTADFTTDVNSGSVTINNSTGSFSLIIRRDMLTEGTENYIVRIRQGSTGGSIIATSDPVPVADISTTPVITANTATVNEGGSVLFTFTTTGMPNGTVVYWNSRNSANTLDFVGGAMTGTIILASNQATITRTITSDYFTETPSVALLLSGDGANTGTTFTDSSPAVRTVSRTGTGIVTRTDQKKYGTASILFPGANTDYLTTANSSAYAVGPKDFTVEYWIYLSALPAYDQTVWDTRATPTSIYGIYDSIGTDGKYRIYKYPTAQYTSTASIPTGVWSHIAVSRVSGTCRVYINGKYDGNYYDPTPYTDDNITIGNNKSNDAGLSGFVDDFRFTSDYGLYTAAGGTLFYEVFSTHFGTGSLNSYYQFPINGNTTGYYGFDSFVNTAVSGTTLHSSGTIAAAASGSSSSIPVLDWTSSATLTGLGISVPNNGDYFATRITGTFVPKETGTYTFTAESDDDVDLLIGSTIVASFYGYGRGVGALGTTTGTISLTAGTAYAFRVRQQEYGGGEGLRVFWRKPSQVSGWYQDADEFTLAPQSALTAYPIAKESFYLEFRRDSNTGVIVANSPTITIEDTTVSPVISANTTSISEGDSVFFQITTYGVPDGTVFYWTMDTVTGSGAALVGDFVGATKSGTVTINSNQATVTRQWALDTKTEGTEVFVLNLRNTSTTGQIIATSPRITVTDTSTGTQEVIYVFPSSIPNPQLQFYFTASALATGTYANSSVFDMGESPLDVPIDSSGRYWKITNGASTTINTYTGFGGATRKYATLPVAGQMRTCNSGGTLINSYNGPLLRTNQGYTFWITYFADWNFFWGGIFDMIGIGQNFHLAVGAGYYGLYYWPTTASSSSGTSFYIGGTSTSGTKQYLNCWGISVGPNSLDGTASSAFRFHGRQYDVINQTLGVSTSLAVTTSTHWMPNTTTAYPSIAPGWDGNMALSVQEVGWANRWFSDGEMASLLDWSLNNYK